MSGLSKLRCAIYTRKSTEEGLEQDFNSLDAQREACEAFIHSQTSLGWKVMAESFDDGGYSGGSMDRPAIARLLDDIRAGKINVVVVYKIDRLTRSLMDFAKIVDIFDSHEVSFVSVTQAFNTTTSMGRLTLNVLLSFAQFEREVTAERIRDKIAASKKKGMWMGGVVPLGYEARDKKLIVTEQEAETVRYLFARYLELKSVRQLCEDAAERGLHARTTRKRDGTIVTTRPFGRGNLYHLLSNPIYFGKVRHRDQLHEGEHEAIISEEIFGEVQALLSSQAARRKHSKNIEGSHLLTGLVFDETGDRLSPVHANKQGKRYRYYVSSRLVKARKGNDPSGRRIPAPELESLVEGEVNRILGNESQLIDWIREYADPLQLEPMLEQAKQHSKRWDAQELAERRKILHRLIDRIEIEANWLRIRFSRRGLAEWLSDDQLSSQTIGAEDEIVTIERPMTIRRRGIETRLVLDDRSAPSRAPDRALVDLVARAHLYLSNLTDGSGKSLSDVAKTHHTDLSEVSRRLPLAFLAPKIIDAILSGHQPPELTAQRLSRLGDLPREWNAQCELLGL